ncbi:hypothetical protein K504DRAFT_504243 [Pleomassaria siparia CBS 279.74]|uniref:Uncharacterized protein n=1 Tax=Pleomassaria siparia CBS 279.74 TaxID=1314801 RepID=A0A6G1K2G2_9PLEO|nr:hypothetical protein K504DRAFT_504243 [Pleomassaria siparia CBS 279.74]
MRPTPPVTSQYSVQDNVIPTNLLISAHIPSNSSPTVGCFQLPTFSFPLPASRFLAAPLQPLCSPFAATFASQANFRHARHSVVVVVVVVVIIIILSRQRTYIHSLTAGAAAMGNTCSCRTWFTAPSSHGADDAAAHGFHHPKSKKSILTCLKLMPPTAQTRQSYMPAHTAAVVQHFHFPRYSHIVSMHIAHYYIFYKDQKQIVLPAWSKKDK